MSEPITLRGAHLTEEEVAAVIAVVHASAGPEQLRTPDDRPRAGGWKSYYRTVRSPLVGGREAWRTYHRM